MDLNSVNLNFGVKPKIKTPKQIQKETEAVEKELRDLFPRDRELFDPRKDKVDDGYFRYGTDDLPLYVNYMA